MDCNGLYFYRPLQSITVHYRPLSSITVYYCPLLTVYYLGQVKIVEIKNNSI